MKDAPRDFNASLPLATFDSWWQLGAAAGDLAQASAREWRAIASRRAAEVTARIREEFPRAPAVKGASLLRFVETVVDLLERKHSGEPIAVRVQQLLHPGRTTVRDEGLHVIVTEDDAEFWATEYALLFGELTPGRERDDWRHAVALCADEECRRFYIKRRSNQEFHSEKCRFNHANRRRRPQKGHGGSGKR